MGGKHLELMRHWIQLHRGSLQPELVAASQLGGGPSEQQEQVLGLAVSLTDSHRPLQAALTAKLEVKFSALSDY